MPIFITHPTHHHTRTPHTHHTGAILFQGFLVREAIDFQEVLQQYNPQLSDEYRGTSPRKLQPGTQVSNCS